MVISVFTGTSSPPFGAVFLRSGGLRPPGPQFREISREPGRRSPAGAAKDPRPPGGHTALHHGEAAMSVSGWGEGRGGRGAEARWVCRGGQNRGHRGKKPGGVRRCRGNDRAEWGVAGAKSRSTGRKTHTGARSGALCRGDRAQIGRKSRADRGKKHTGAGFSGENFREKGGHRGKKGGRGAAYRGKKPQKAGSARRKKPFSGRYCLGA